MGGQKAVSGKQRAVGGEGRIVALSERSSLTRALGDSHFPNSPFSGKSSDSSVAPFELTTAAVVLPPNWNTTT